MDEVKHDRTDFKTGDRYTAITWGHDSERVILCWDLPSARAPKITPIITDATFFVTKLKERLVELNLLVPDSRYTGLLRFAGSISHEKGHLWKDIDREKHPSIIFSSFYQDGIIQGLTFVNSRRKSGEPSNPRWAPKIAKQLVSLIHEMEEKKNYEGIAYLNGFDYGLTCFASEKERDVAKKYFLFGKNGGISLDEFYKIEEEFIRENEEVKVYAEENVRMLGHDLTPHMQPPAILMSLVEGKID